PNDKYFAIAGVSPGTEGIDYILTADAQTGQIIDTAKAHTEAIESLDFSPDGTSLASASHDNTIKVWSMSPDGHFQGENLLRGHSGDVTSVAFFPDGEHLASGSNDRTVRIWRRNGQSWNLMHSMRGHEK